MQQVLWAAEVTSRNNVFDLTGGTDRVGISMGKRAVQAADSVRVYNNTFYSADASKGSFVAVAVESSVANAVVRNNLAHAPNDSSPRMVSGTGAAAVIASHNSVDPKRTPGFAGPLSTLAGFKIKSSSYAVKAGATAVPVFSDIFGLDRPANIAPDLGAAEALPLGS